MGSPDHSFIAHVLSLPHHKATLLFFAPHMVNKSSYHAANCFKRAVFLQFFTLAQKWHNQEKLNQPVKN
ncbi:hypothetical protein DT73_03125 [Mangrovibacter sp. MFB070]|nr:hypothetical protein DT73_03125 [Mangrovibacter sp. MFB070]